jgi:hypothetical protein
MGEDPSALLTLEIDGRKASLVRGDKGYKMDAIGNLERLYNLVEE